MHWNPNIDAGLTAEGYEIYGPFPGKGYSLSHNGERIDYFPTLAGAKAVAESHRAALSN